MLARRNGLVASLEASRAAFRAFEKLQIEEIAHADAELAAALKNEPADLVGAAKRALIVISRDVRKGSCPASVEQGLQTAIANAEAAK